MDTLFYVHVYFQGEIPGISLGPYLDLEHATLVAVDYVDLAVEGMSLPSEKIKVVYLKEWLLGLNGELVELSVKSMERR